MSQGRSKQRRKGGRVTMSNAKKLAAMALVAGMVATPSLAGAGTSSSTTTSAQSSVTLSGLNAAFKTQQQALTQRQALELARLADEWAKKVADRQAAGTAEQAGITSAMNGAVAPVAAKRDADLAAVEMARRGALGDIPGRYDAKRADRQAFIDQMAAQMPAKPHPLSYDAALLVRQQMMAQLKVEQEGLDA